MSSTQAFSRNTGDRFERETTSRAFSGEGLQQSNVQYQQPSLIHPTFNQSATQSSFMQSNQPFQQGQFLSSQRQSIVEPTMIQEKPAVVHERIRKEEVEEIQPIIHREHEKLEVHQIVQPMVQQIVQPTVIQERLLAAETRPLIQKGTYVTNAAPLPTSDVQSFHKVVEKAPIVVEVERRKVLEEIQPVVYKEILQPTIVRETRDIYERIIEPPTIISSTLPQQYVGKAQPQFEPTLRGSTFQSFQGQNFGSSNLASSNLASSNLASSNLGSSNLASSNLQSQNLGSQNLASGQSAMNPSFQYMRNQPSNVSQRETVDRWISPAPMISPRV